MVRRRVRLLASPLIALVCVVGLWWAGVRVFDVAPYVLPSPGDVGTALVEYLPLLYGPAGQTWGHTAAGFAVGTGVAVAVAVVLAMVGWLRDAWMPLLVALPNVPTVALAPALVILCGYGASPKVVLVALICFFPALIGTRDGLAAVPREFDELARMWSAPRWRYLLSVQLPHALPRVFGGLRLAAAFALVGAVVAEMRTSDAGLGAVVVRSYQYANTPLMYAAIVLLATMGITHFYVLVAAERLALPWARHTTAPPN